MSGFYERLVGCSKTVLSKSIGKKYLTQLQLQTYLSETKVALNSRPLVYIGDDLNDGITITLSHFLTLNTKTGTPIVKEEKLNNPSSEEVLPNTSKKGTSNFRILLEDMER